MMHLFKNLSRPASRIAALGIGAALMFGMPQTADALWPFHELFAKNDKDQEHLPPAINVEKETCDPIRQKVITLNQANRFTHPFVRPRIGLLKRKYQKCMNKYRDQEYDYLKHATITIPEEKPAPDLPPLNTTPAQVPSGSLKKQAPDTGDIGEIIEP